MGFPAHPASYPSFGGIAGEVPPSSSPGWFYFPAQGDRVSKSVLTSWGSTSLKIQATLRNIEPSDPDEYWIGVCLFDVTEGARIVATQIDAVAPLEGFDLQVVSKTFLRSVLTSSGPFIAAWAYHVAATVTPVTPAPKLSILGFHVERA